MEELGAYKVEKSGSRRSSVERREEILKVALSVLAERGYRGSSMREIAERAQASKETLYAWFGNKQGLFEELVGWQAERVDAVIAPKDRKSTRLNSSHANISYAVFCLKKKKKKKKYIT